ncbi:hypothetical protein B0H17DRAFT_1034043 [Mycena rosella]|uniref:Uncharacterized protein n=1 Tax=Mycena rosella TaxID=1033263 RepID=A0AAD7MA69_MYCRO|nr:hypothetical protein B0H17DRAFT_1034043 [Mycena rosella]
MVHHHARRIHNRQDPDGLLNTPTAVGINSASVATGGVAAPNSLVFDTAAATGLATDQVVNFSASATGTFTTPAPSGTSDASTDPSSSSVQSGASSEISMGTVIGACLGALAGAVVIVLVGLWLFRRGNKPRQRSPSNARKPVDKERAWGKLEDDNEDKWEAKEGKYQQNGVVSVGPMEKLTMFKKTPSMRTTYTTSQDHEPLPSVAPFAHPFAQYHPDLAKELAQGDGSDFTNPPHRPFLARVEAVPPISWDGDTVGRDSFLSLNSNSAMSPGTDIAIPTPKLTSSEPHYWESAEVMHYDQNGDALPRGRPTSDVVEAKPRRKSSNNPFFGARMSTHSTHSPSRSQSRSRSRTPSLSSPSKTNLPEPDPVTMPTPPPAALTRQEKGKFRAATPPSPTSSMAPSTITGHNPFSDPIDPIVPFKPEHFSQSSHDRALQSLIAALGPSHSAADVQERLRVASMNPSFVSDAPSAYTETEYGDDAATLHQSWPVPPSRP